MACACNGSRQRAGAVLPSGGTVLGYEVTYTDGTIAPGLFMTILEAKKEIRSRGGGTVRQITQ